MDFPNWLEWTGTRYFAATVFGFLVALGVELGATAIANRRKRRFIREAIAEEVAFNLNVLNQYLDALIKIHKHPVGALRLPRQRLLTPLMTRCIDPETGSLLSTQEWLIATNAIQQCDIVNSAMLDLWERVTEVVAEPDVNLRASYAKNESARIVDTQLPVLGQTLMELLCQIMERQVEYNSTKMMRIAVALNPARKSGSINARRTWRVRYWLGLENLEGVLIAWKNDARDGLPAGLIVIEIDPGVGGDQVRKDDDGVLSRLARRRFNRTALAKLGQQEAYLKSTKQARETQIGKLTELYSQDDTNNL